MRAVNMKMNQSSDAYKNAINFNIVTIFHLDVERACALPNLFIVQRLKCLTVFETWRTDLSSHTENDGAQVAEM